MEEKVELFKNGKRHDGRKVGDLRDIKIKAHVINQADGSCYLEWGNNKVIAAVCGPKECIPHHMSSPYRAIIKSQYMMTPSSTPEHGRSGPNRRSKEISEVIKNVFDNVVILEQYPGKMIEIFMYILEADGGTRCAALTAASVALADAGIPMKDMVQGLAVGKVGDKMAVDLNYIEDSQGESDMALAITHRNKEILLLQMEGILTKEQNVEGMSLAVIASDSIYDKQIDALKAVYDDKIDGKATHLSIKE